MKKIKFGILFIALLGIFLIACQKENGRKLTITHKTINFNVGFPPSRLVHFTDHKKDYVAFADFATYKKIAILSMQGNRLFTIPLQKMMQSNQTKFMSYDVINLDSFALLTKYTNKVFIANKKGQILFKKDYSRFDSLGIGLYPPFSVDQGVLKSCISWEPVQDTLTYKEWHHKSNLFAKLFIDSSFRTANFGVTLALDSLYCRFAKDNENLIGPIITTPIGQKTLFSSFYVDSLYQFNQKFDLDTSIRIKSNYFPIDFKAQTDEEIEKNDKNNKTVNPFSTHSKIIRLIHDKFRKFLYVVIAGPYKNVNHIPYSIAIYDYQLNKIGEKKIDGKKFTSQMFVTQKGLYIRNRDDSLKTATFTLFRYE